MSVGGQMNAIRNATIKLSIYTGITIALNRRNLSKSAAITMTDTILIIDDCRDSNELIKFVLERNTDWKIITTLNAREGIIQAQLSQPSLILLDVAMPDCDGFDVYKSLKSDRNTRSIPVIFTTAMVGMEERIKRQISADIKVLPKPFNIRLLKTQITEQLSAIAT